MSAEKSRLANIGRSAEDIYSNHEVEDAKGEKFKFFRDDKGRVYPPFGHLAIAQMKDLEIRDDDVMLAGFPKTGSHWSFQVLNMVNLSVSVPDASSKLLGFIEFTAPSVTDTMSSPRILNSHIRYSEMPSQLLTKKTKIVLTVRNPKDTLVSFFHHHRSPLLKYNYRGELQDYFPLFMDGKLDYGDIFDYYADWDKEVQAHPDHPILVLSFEDMKEDLPREIRRLAKFLGKELEENLVQDIAKAAGFESMLKNPEDKRYLRKGMVGDWKNHLTVAQSDYMDKVIQEKMSNLTIYKPRLTLP